MPDADKTPPPYMSFGIFKGTAEQLAGSTVPTGPLDRRVLDGLSGADYGALISGLRFLGLTDKERRATETYRKLIHAWKTPDDFKTLLLNIMSDRYSGIVGGVDIKHGTISELEKAFKDVGVAPGQMLTKTIRFYIKALQDCAIDVSPHITKARKPTTPRAPRTNGSPRKQNGGKSDSHRGKEQPLDPERKVDTPEGFERLPIPGVAGAFIQYPTGLTEANCDLFDAMIGVLRTYVKGRTAAGKEKKP